MFVHPAITSILARKPNSRGWASRWRHSRAPALAIYRGPAIKTPALIVSPDIVTTVQGVLPPKAATVFCIIDIPPESKDPIERERGIRATFGELFRDANHNPEPDHIPARTRRP